MMGRYFFMLVIVCGFSLTGNSQGLNNSSFLQRQKMNFAQKNDSTPQPLVGNRDLNGSNVYAASSILSTSADESVAYYQHVAKQYGWFVGIGPALTAEQVRHLNVVYKLSNRNQTGHWMKLETLDGYGNYTTEHEISVYVSSSIKNDSLINEKWQSKTEQACQWEFMPDGSGNMVVVERAYDKDNKLIYNFQPVFISKNEIIGSYTDSWGLPVKVYLQNGKFERILVNIQYDKWGNDSVVKYVDTEGNLLKNSAGSWIIRNICDKNGIVLENYSLNQLGSPINDYAGNCSWKAKYDEWGNVVRIDYFDAGGNPIRISYKQSFYDVSGIRYKYDRWHRMISQSFYYGERADATSQGVHRIEYTYNNHGQTLSVKCKGKYNEPRVFGESKFAYKYKEYDSEGRVLSEVFLGADSAYIHDNNYFCRREYEYNRDELKQERSYMRNGNDTILWHLESFSSLVNTYYDYDNEAYVDSLDRKGNIISRTYVSLNQDPMTLPDRTPVYHSPYSRRFSSYQYKPHKCIETTTYYDCLGNWRREMAYKGAAHKIVETDFLAHTIRHTEYNEDTIMLSNYQEFYDEQFNILKYKQSLTKTGNMGRTYFGDDLYYKAKVEYGPTGKVVSIQYLNEFDEPAYAYNNYTNYCYQVIDDEGNPQFYDEYKNLLERYSGMYDKPKAVCIELLDEKGKDLGLRDGDILVRYDNWFYNHNNSQLFDHVLSQLYAQMIFSSIKDSLDIWVMRHFPAEHNSKIIKLRIKAGKLSEMGFVVNTIILTEKETMRYLQTFMKFKDEEEKRYGAITPVNIERNNRAQIIVPRYKEKKHANPALVLSKKSIQKSGWPFLLKKQVYNYGEDDFISDVDEFILFFTEDGIKIHCDSIDSYIGTQYVNLTDEENEIAQNLLKQITQDSSSDNMPDNGNNSLYILKSQPSNNSISTLELIQTLERERLAVDLRGRIGFRETYKNGKVVLESLSVNSSKSNLLDHVEGIDSVKSLEIRSSRTPDAEKYRALTYKLDKRFYSSVIMPSDSIEIAEKGVVFIHETPAGIDDILYMSKDTIVWARGCMPFSSGEIIKRNMDGLPYNPANQYSRRDIRIAKNPLKYKIASFWHNNHIFDKSIPLLRSLSRQKCGPACALLAEAYTKGNGVPIDTVRAISLYKKAVKYGEHFQGTLGKLYYETRQYASALHYLKYIVDLDACEKIGRIYEQENHKLFNLDSALYYYQKGRTLANKIHSSVSMRYAIRKKFMEKESRVSKKLVYLPEDFRELSSAKSEMISKDSLYKVGQASLYNGDFKKAYSFLKAAADSLYPLAEVGMASLFENKKLPIYNKQIALEYRQNAINHFLALAEKGDSSAYHSIANIYMSNDVEGKGVDKEKAKMYYLKSLNQKYVESAAALGDIFYNEYKFREALDVYLIGAKEGNSKCMYQTALLYELGVGGVERNMTESINWYLECYQATYKEKSSLNKKAKNALQRLGAPFVPRIVISDMVGIWKSNSGMYEGKIFLPNGKFIGFDITNDNYISEIRNCTFKPWMMGSYYLRNNMEYVEYVEMRKGNEFLGEQDLTIQIENGIMYNTWRGAPESWKKQDDTDPLIDYIMKNWDKYADYVTKEIMR